MLGFGLDSNSSLDFSGTLDLFHHACILLCPLLANCLMVISVSCLFIWEVFTVSLLHAVGNGVRTGPGTQQASGRMEEGRWLDWESAKVLRQQQSLIDWRGV